MFRRSNDLRLRVVEYVKNGASKTSAVKLFKVARQTIYEWLELDKKGELLKIDNYQTRVSKLDYDEIKKFIEQHPDFYYHEIGDHFGTSDENIRKICKKLQITVKKNKRYTRKPVSN